jgi:hypothetical protein
MYTACILYWSKGDLVLADELTENETQSDPEELANEPG